MAACASVRPCGGQHEGAADLPAGAVSGAHNGLGGANGRFADHLAANRVGLVELLACGWSCFNCYGTRHSRSRDHVFGVEAP